MHRIAQAAMVTRPAKIANHNVRSIYLTKKEPAFAAFFDRIDLIEIDPTPWLFFTRVLGFTVGASIVTLIDGITSGESQATTNGASSIYLGKGPSVAAEAARK